MTVNLRFFALVEVCLVFRHQAAGCDRSSPSIRKHLLRCWGQEPSMGDNGCAWPSSA